MNLLTVGVMFMMIESYGYLAQNTTQTQRDRTTQRREERKERNSALFVPLRCRYVWLREFANNPG